jgi:kynurenine formamidase
MLFLSHPLSENTVGYGGKKDFLIQKTQALSAGQSCNQSHWSLNNHIGTHIDAPFHFSDSGKTLDQYDAEFWNFKSPHLINLPTADAAIIDVGPWCQDIPDNCDLLLIKTGFEKNRHQEIYWSHNPGLSPQVGQWLRNHRKNIRALGFDFISLTSYQHRPLGKEAHKAFLVEQPNTQPILLIEDMHLEKLTQAPARIIVAPMIVTKSDGAPVTIFAEF